MVKIYDRYADVYRQVLDMIKDRTLSPQEKLIFGNLDNLAFYEFMERYTRELFHHNTSDYINPENDFKIRTSDLPIESRLFRGTNSTFLTQGSEYALAPTHDTSWSYSPTEALDWLRYQKNPRGTDIIVVTTIGDVLNNGSLKQTDAGVFLFHSDKQGLLTPTNILKSIGKRLIKIR